ncbi:MAG: 3-phosphoshikimate 1-carboxyvinyltransferase, partial [Anaerolineae bacterium]|nr:3-phosphoshikimate 1-carboxyvinyltransferase [Anaerolineae bacterium]
GKFPPLAIQGGALHGATHRLAVASAQVKSCLLLAGLLAEGTTTVRSPAPSRDHTERLLEAMGVPLVGAGVEVAVAGPVEALAPLDLTVPGDFSSAAFLLVAACLVPGSEVLLQGVGLNPTRIGLLHVLRQMGASVEVQADEAFNAGEPAGDLLVRWSPLRGTEVGGEAIPALIDEVPVLAVAATQAEGTTVVRDAADLRHKESDRIAATVQELQKMGAQIAERPDGFVVEGPTRLRGTRVDSHGDHRLALALAVAGLVAEGETVVEGFARAADSFPGFPEMLAGLLGIRR